MKRQRFRFRLIALLLFGLFLLLGGYGIHSVSLYGGRWFSYTANPRLSALKKRTVKGSVYDRKGLVLASTEKEVRSYSDSEEIRKALVHVLGDRNGMVANGVESFQAGYLYGYNSSMENALRRLTHPEEITRGNDLVLTVDARLSAAIPKFFSVNPVSHDKNGAAVVINYKSGEILALISLPSFDPDAPPERDESDSSVSDHPYWNRATQGLYPPGSTFKIITSAAALAKNPDVLFSSFLCNGTLPVSETFSIHDFRNTIHGELTLEQAFQHSCNIVFASLALETGYPYLKKVSEKFGFNQNFLFRDLVVYNSSFPSEEPSEASLAACGYGQSSIVMTPFHLCLVSAAIANQGRMPEPRLLYKIVSSGGNETVFSGPASPIQTVCSASVAEQISLMMKSVVQNGGSGSKASVPTLDIRGKTGTSESTSLGRKINYGWFTGFAAQKDLPVAVCVLVEDIPDGETGGTAAAPIAHNIFSWIKNHPDILKNDVLLP